MRLEGLDWWEGPPPLSTAAAIHMLREQAEMRGQALGPVIFDEVANWDGPLPKPVPVVAAVALAPFAWLIERRRRVGGL